jgi:DNA-binding IclR family transcriptional regulator
MEKAGSAKTGNSRNQKGTQSVLRTIALLRAVGKHNDRGVNLSRIARETDLHVATAHRILLALVSEKFLTYDPMAKLYHLGIELFNLGREARQFDIRDQYRHAIEEIARETEDTVFLLIRSGNDVLCIDLVEGSYPIRTMTITVGARRPLGIGAGSLALIAFLSNDLFEDILAVNEHRYSQYGGLTAANIQTLGKRSRKQGYVVSKGLFHDGVTSVGTPVYNRLGEVVAAITVATIDKRMGVKRREEIAGLVRKITGQNE